MHERSEGTLGGPGRALLLIGIASGMLYVVVLVAQRVIQRGPRTGGLIAYVTATIGLFVLFAALLRICAKGGLPTRGTRVLAIAFPVLFNLLFVLVPPNFSIDLLSYISHGYIETTLDANPYVEPSSIVSHTPLGSELAHYGWRPVHPVSPYGPAWTRIEATVVQGFDGVRIQMDVLKLIAAVFSLGSALLIWRILDQVRPEYQLLGTFAYLWNPMIVVELAGEGHNDAVMVFFVLLALLLTLRKRISGGLVAMSLGVLTKYLPLLLVPLQLVYAWRTRRSTTRFASQTLFGTVIGVSMASILFAGLWVGAETLMGVRLSGRSGDTGSTQTILVEGLSRVVPPTTAEAFVSLLAIVGLAVSLLSIAWSVREEHSLLRACASISVFYLLFISPSYWPWYAVMPVALLALIPGETEFLVLLTVSLGSRLAAPLDVLFVNEVLGRRAFLASSWVLGLGVPILFLMLSRAGRWSPSILPASRSQSFTATRMTFFPTGGSRMTSWIKRLAGTIRRS
jgi:alpha-1,6-mannosyltransferase